MLFTSNPLHRLMAHRPAQIASLLQLCSLRGQATAPNNQLITRLAACCTSLHVAAPMPPSALSLAPQPRLQPNLPSHIRSFLTLPGMDSELSKKHHERRLVGYARQALCYGQCTTTFSSADGHRSSCTMLWPTLTTTMNLCHGASDLSSPSAVTTAWRQSWRLAFVCLSSATPRTLRCTRANLFTLGYAYTGFAAGGVLHLNLAHQRRENALENISTGVQLHTV